MVTKRKSSCSVHYQTKLHYHYHLYVLHIKSSCSHVLTENIQQPRQSVKIYQENPSTAQYQILSGWGVEHVPWQQAYSVDQI